jgi:hypothetical protein
MQVEMKTLLQQPAIAYMIVLFKTKRWYFPKNSHSNTGVGIFYFNVTLQTTIQLNKRYGKIKL